MRPAACGRRMAERLAQQPLDAVAAHALAVLLAHAQAERRPLGGHIQNN